MLCPCLCRQIYWSDWGRRTLEKVNYDGSDRQVIVSGAVTSEINGIALDVLGELGGGGGHQGRYVRENPEKSHEIWIVL